MTMIPKISHPCFQNFQQSQLSPRSPRNKIQRKPDNLRSRYYEDKDKKFKSRGNQFVGYYSPKHYQDQHMPSDPYQLGNSKIPQIKTLKNQRSLTNFNKGNIENKNQEVTTKNKQNSISNSSNRSSRQRYLSRLQLQLKALTYENVRLRGENKKLIQQNQAMKFQMIKLSQNSNTRTFSLMKPPINPENNEKIARMAQTIHSLQMELKQLRQEIVQVQGLKKCKIEMESIIESLQGVNMQQRQQIFQQEKVNKYMQIQLRTLKKQRIGMQMTKKIQMQYQNIEADNKRLRKMVSELQSKLKNNLIFDLTPDVSQKSQSFLLD